MPGDDTETHQVAVETDPPSTDDAIDRSKTQEGVRLLLEAIGEDPDDEVLQDTWHRRGPAAFETLTEGTRDEAKPELRTFPADTDDLVGKTGIPVYSLCSHHLLPYHGTAHVAYRPDEEVVGLSKLTRYVRWQSRRLTMQEELTQDIAQELQAELNAEGVMVELQATHLCKAMWGVETASTTTTRSTVGDVDEAVKQRFRDVIDREDLKAYLEIATSISVRLRFSRMDSSGNSGCDRREKL